MPDGANGAKVTHLAYSLYFYALVAYFLQLRDAIVVVVSVLSRPHASGRGGGGIDLAGGE